MDPSEVVQQFYSSLAHKDSRWQENLAENIRFSDASGRLNAEGRDAFIQAFDRFLPAIAALEVKQLITEGPAVAAVVGYDYVNPAGDRLHQDDAEVWRIEDGQVVSLTIYFDVTEFRTFMGR